MMITTMIITAVPGVTTRVTARCSERHGRGARRW
jgi:hypothetical protein